MKKIIDGFVGGEPFKIFIGTDSDGNQDFVVFATALVVYKVGVGGIYFYKLKREKKYHDIYSRLFEEVHLSIEMANFVKQSLGLNHAEIHIDAGQDGESKEIISTLVGYVKGMGYNFKLKPWAFAASKIAHRHTK
ncbi:ribonuclease H-like YkuK family protein [Pseudothermotoga thermarum]|uniref:ribonuclease H-like YkuK family protein n=1 Tax=Pseudothermotoga thermarum TaxID=119394 RepID=UPI00031A8CCC|nr:ribonuclease H-like YkuK family protein [Pseudothermotoga thermarum]